MTTFPLPLGELLGHWGSYVVYVIIGFAFGYVLEIAGFGNSKKLAAQFYFKDQTVLKVMFGAIIVAMVLIFWVSGLGWLDYNLIWVNPTYLWPGIVGGLIMGLGFIIGGFCPGTSLVAAATLKLDGIFFVFGVFFGIFIFGESVGSISDFWNSSNMGRYTLPQWLGLPTGTVVLLVVLMALFMFWGAEKLEQHFGGKDAADEPKWRIGAGGGIALAAVGLIAIGQPTILDRWDSISTEKNILLEERTVQAHPAEMLDLIHDPKIQVRMLDIRSEADYNQFHILDAEHMPLDDIPELVPLLHLEPANTVFFVMSNDETAATSAWKTLQAESVPNVYILEGGVNNWLTLFANDEFLATNGRISHGDDQLAFAFPVSLGARQFPAEPDPHQFEFIYTPKVVLELKRAPTSGGCG
ncbi:MAG: YeeE/YedE family protein [Chloroflexi bacterium]|nr:YeeE/YedE family protein [Chloroflexota bacterium]